ncbi:MAG TPA: radical SAM protein [Nitrospirales bacterium]|nr:radical SAM protein [Nitrospirales bacterium]
MAKQGKEMTTPRRGSRPTPQSELITENPTGREKGFKAENIRVIAPTAEDAEVAKRLADRLAAGDGHRINPSDRTLVATIQASYERKRAGVSPEVEDFTLSDHERREFRVVQPTDTLRYLIYRYKYQKYPELKVIEQHPPCVQIEPTSICNFRCIMCYQIDETFSHKSSGFMGHMSLDLFKKVIDQIAGSVEAVTLASRGEPLLNLEILEMIAYCRGKFLALKVNTNAALLNERMAHGLLSSDMQTLVFSIDSADKEQYERIRVNGNFEKILANLELFQKLRETQYPHSQLVVRISGVKLNEHQEIDRMSNQWKRFADVVAFTNYTPWQDSYNNSVNDVTTPCTELWRRMFVWWDGTVNPCDFDYKSVLSHWNITESGQTVQDIWTSEQYDDLRKRHLSGNRGSLDPCRRCVMM